jgi:uncharacterized membrane protein YuzA (DUF378 family)
VSRTTFYKQGWFVQYVAAVSAIVAASISLIKFSLTSSFADKIAGMSPAVKIIWYVSIGVAVISISILLYRKFRKRRRRR